MKVAERNRKIKKALSKIFKKVRVKGGRGTAYGWVDILIFLDRPHPGECRRPEGWYGYYECQECRKEIEGAKEKVWKILKEEGLTKELGRYWSDAGDYGYECIVEIKWI